MSKTTTGNEEREFGGKFLNDILSYVEQTFLPEDIFDVDVLEAGAEENGYVKESE